MTKSELIKSELIERVAEKAEISKAKAEIVVKVIFDTMLKSLAQDARIELRGFGTFVNRRYSAYKGRNPRTGEKIDVKQKKLPFFRVGKELKEELSKSLSSSAKKKHSKKGVGKQRKKR